MDENQAILFAIYLINVFVYIEVTKLDIYWKLRDHGMISKYICILTNLRLRELSMYHEIMKTKESIR